MSTDAPFDVAGELWLRVLQRAMARASHDVKDAINGVSVNLEVIRSRAARPDTPASAVANFGEAAGHQLDRLTSLIEAVLALGRAEREPADVVVTLRRVITLCGASSAANDALVRLDEVPETGATVTRVHGTVVRLALLAPLLDVVSATSRTERASAVSCFVGGSETAVEVRIAATGRRAAVPEGAAEALRAAGVSWSDAGQDLTLAFPRA